MVCICCTFLSHHQVKLCSTSSMLFNTIAYFIKVKHIRIPEKLGPKDFRWLIWMRNVKITSNGAKHKAQSTHDTMCEQYPEREREIKMMLANILPTLCTKLLNTKQNQTIDKHSIYSKVQYWLWFHFRMRVQLLRPIVFNFLAWNQMQTLCFKVKDIKTSNIILQYEIKSPKPHIVLERTDWNGLVAFFRCCFSFHCLRSSKLQNI